MGKSRGAAPIAISVLLTFALVGCGGKATSSSVETAGSSSSVAEAASTTDATSTTDDASANSKVATSADMAAPVELDLTGLVPVTAGELNEGTYKVEVESSSSMFKIDSCELVVKDGVMQARLTMGSSSFEYLFPGTAEEAAAATESAYLKPEEVDGSPVFTLTIDALDAPVDCAAFSKKKQLWYDRTLVFKASTLPGEAFKEARGTTVADLGVADGSYTAEVELTGGSGKASVSSPAQLTIAGGKATARIEWSSSNYDYMLVDGERFEPLNSEGNSVFEIPVAAFDTKLAVKADTTAMSTPHEIEYGLTFSSATLTPAEG